MDDIIIEKILKLFGLPQKNYFKQKSSIYVETDHSTKIIKRTSAKKQQLMFSHFVKEHLFSAGFKNIDRYFKSVQNLPFVNFDNTMYIMTDAYPSELDNVNLANLQELIAVTKQLALMHELFSKDVTNIPSFNNVVIENTNYYKKRLLELSHIKKWIDSQPHLSDFDILYIKNYKYYLKRINAAFELSKQINYRRLKEKIISEKKFVHNAFKEQNIKMANGDIFILNFENATYGSSIADLAVLMKNYIKKDSFEPYVLNELMHIYKEIHSITPDELMLLKVMLIFPSKYSNLVNYHYNKRRTWISDSSRSRLQFCLEQNERQEMAIERILRL